MSIVEGGAKLDWEVFIKRRGSATQGMPPGKEDLAWVTNAVTLVSGNRDALLVDTFLSEEHNSELADWIAAKDKHLALIYVTHGHPDHFFGLKILKERFPEARILARSNVVEAMRRAIEPEALENWRRRWPNQIAKDLILADKLDTDLFKLEGHDCRIIDTGHTDTDNTTALHIPSIGLMVSGDAVYNETHPYLGETSGEGYGGWLRALDKIEALDPRAVVAGHGPLHQDCSPSHIAKTRLYIETFVAISKTTSSPLELYERMLQMYPDRINPGSLWAGAHKAKALGVMEPGLQHYEIASAADENAIARRESAPTWEVLGVTASLLSPERASRQAASSAAAKTRTSTAGLVQCANWDLFRLFFIAAHAGSMNSAARQLGMSQPTLSRRLTELERDVGAPLLFRTPTGIALTQEGESLRRSAATMLRAFEAFQEDVQQQIALRSSVVRISASEGMTKHWLLPRLKRLRDMDDRLQFEVHTTACQRSLASGDLDFVIRIGEPGDGELVGKRVGQVAFGIYASEAYLKSRPAPQSVDDLRDHCLIGATLDIPGSRRETGAGQDLVSRFLAAEAAGCCIKVSHVAGQTAAASVGMGLALLAVPFAEADGLSRVLPNVCATLDVWLLRRRESDLRRQTRRLQQFLERELRASKEWLSGHCKEDAASG